jgi:hypothetical protein
VSVVSVSTRRGKQGEACSIDGEGVVDDGEGDEKECDSRRLSTRKT